MTDKELTDLVKEISSVYFGKEFENVAKFNARLKTTGGRFHLKDGHIDINPAVVEKYNENTLVGIIKHELVHYHLYYSGLRRHSHGSKEFKELLLRVGGLRYAPKFVESKKKKYKIYECSSCGLRYKRIKKINTQKFVCGKCRGRLIFLEEKYL
ncbi:SprT family protein [Companilactobacillus sp. DQM5]|uniref:SprT family protein n=1 Tax=Companilactobacillus sp. DQM5 TaxID=3463359 RepID=UPI00405954BC